MLLLLPLSPLLIPIKTSLLSLSLSLSCHWFSPLPCHKRRRSDLNSFRSETMNPLCCIAPVSLDAIDSTTTSAPPLISPKPRPLPLPSAAKPLALTQSPTNPGEPVASQVIEENRSNEAGKGAIVVAGLLYKWVNYGKGWRSRWFVLEDGVLSYYKVHGPDRISVGPVCGANGGVRVIGEDSLRRVRRDQACAYGSASGRKWKPFGEIHLKV